MAVCVTYRRVRTARVYLYMRELRSGSSVWQSGSVISFKEIEDTGEDRGSDSAYKHWGLVVEFGTGVWKFCEAYEEEMYLKGRIINVSDDEFDESQLKLLGEAIIDEEDLEAAVFHLNHRKMRYMFTWQNCQYWVNEMCGFLNLKVPEKSSLDRGLKNYLYDFLYMVFSAFRKAGLVVSRTFRS